MPLAKDLLHPLPAEEKRKHKLKRLVQHPNSYFMDVKCPGCYKITTVFSHAQGVVVCTGCSTILSSQQEDVQSLPKDARSERSRIKVLTQHRPRRAENFFVMDPQPRTSEK